jgi:hypothetical protein
MRVLLILVLAAAVLPAQTGQQGSRPEWPCVAGHAVDPAHLDVGESTGGQIFIVQKDEIAQAGLFLNAPSTHPVTVLRAVGKFSGIRDFEFPVDSTIRSLLVMASVQCRKSIGVFRPAGSEMVAANSTQSVDLRSSRAVKIDTPEPGNWKLRLEGSGLFVLSVQAESPIRVSAIEFAESQKQPQFGVRQRAAARVSGELTRVGFQLLGPAGDLITSAEPPESLNGLYRFPILPITERFRIRMTAVDAAGWPVQRTYPVLFRTRQE